MVVEGLVGNAILDDLINASAQMAQKTGRLVLWLQALGIIVLFWLLFQLLNAWSNRKKIKMISEMEDKLLNMEKRIEQDILRLESKIDKVIKKR